LVRRFEHVTTSTEIVSITHVSAIVANIAAIVDVATVCRLSNHYFAEPAPIREDVAEHE
jgi:hypothetical protein